MLTDQYLIYCIDNAKINKDTINVELNSSIRFITNPFYEWKKGEYENKSEIKSKLVNKFLGDEKVNNNYKNIFNCICDHDCKYGKITIKSISKDAKLSIRTIINYFNNYPLLNRFFHQVSELSQTEKQRKNSKYYKNKLVKRAS